MNHLITATVLKGKISIYFLLCLVCLLSSAFVLVLNTQVGGITAVLYIYWTNSNRHFFSAFCFSVLTFLGENLESRGLNNLLKVVQPASTMKAKIEFWKLALDSSSFPIIVLAEMIP